MKRATTRDQAIDQAIGRPSEGPDDLWMLEFYAEANLPCPTTTSLPRALLHLQGMGGSGSDHPRPNTVQPASTALTVGTDEFAATWPAWVRFDSLSYAAGSKITGSLWTASGPGESPAHKGSFGGRFEAVVCPVTRGTPR
jgi:hypothetical protein